MIQTQPRSTREESSAASNKKKKTKLDDVPAVLGSLDIVFGEVDR